MDLTDAELEAIERACRAQVHSHRERASKMDRPTQRNQANDTADQFARIVSRIENERRSRSQAARRCATCDD